MVYSHIKWVTTFSDTSVENLKYLSSEQALADLAAFRAAMVDQFALTEKNKWISFGGSYPGALSAWFRYKYPHLVHGKYFVFLLFIMFANK